MCNFCWLAPVAGWVVCNGFHVDGFHRHDKAFVQIGAEDTVEHIWLD